jgi:hypothetical protein
MTIGSKSIAITPNTQTMSVASTQVLRPEIARWLVSREVTKNDTRIVTSDIPLKSRKIQQFPVPSRYIVHVGWAEAFGSRGGSRNEQA